jgi:hypothetical protein
MVVVMARKRHSGSADGKGQRRNPGDGPSGCSAQHSSHPFSCWVDLRNTRIPPLGMASHQTRPQASALHGKRRSTKYARAVSNRQAWLISVVVLLAGVAFFVVRAIDSGLGGSTGDKITKRIEQECGASTRDRVEPEDFRVPEFENQATEVIHLTCPEGEINPYATLIRFQSPTALLRAYDAGGAKVQSDWYCIAHSEAISGDFRDFVDLCRELGGRFRCPELCRERIRTRKITPVPVEGDQLNN